MSLVTGNVKEIYVEDGVTFARVSVSGALIRVPLTLVMNVRTGDSLLIDSGVAISRIDKLSPDELQNKGYAHVSGDSR